MEEEYHGGAALHHPLLHAAGRLHPSSAAALASYPTTHSQWDDDPPQQLLPLDYGGHDQQQQLREALLRALGELDASRAELRRVESERDEIRRHYHSLLLLLHHHHSSQPPPPGFELQGGCAAMDELPQGIRTGTAASMSSEEGDYYAAEAEMALPEKGRLVEAVVAAGPLLQTLLLAGPLPRWRHPPPPAPADMVIPPFNPGAANSSFSSASASASSSSPESGNCGGGPALPVVVALPLGQQQDALPCFRIMTTGSPFCM